MQSSHASFEQAGGYPQQNVFPGFLSTMPANSAHDMSKQVPAGQPAIYSNAGGIPSASQHHQSPMTGPTPSMQQASLVQHGQQMNRAQMSMPGYYTARNNVARSVPNMARNPVGGVVNQSQQQPYHLSIVPQQNMIPMAALTAPCMQPMALQQRQFNPHQQYQVFSANQLYYPTASYCYNNPPTNANGHYYPSPNVPPYNVMPPQMTQMPANNNGEVKRPKKILSIIDPNTGENVMKEPTPPSQVKENENNDPSICIQFATQVAAAALATDKVEPAKNLEDPRISRPVVMCSSEMEPVNNLETSNSGDTVIESHIESQSNPCAEETISFYKEDFSGINDSYETNKCASESIDSVPVVQDTEVYKEFPEEIASELNVIETNDNLLPQEEDSPMLDKPVEYEIEEVILPKVQVMAEVLPVKDTFESTLVIPPTAVVDEVKDLATNADIPSSDISAKVQEKPFSESKKNKAKKKKDLNKRGENKEGGEMDAFLDKNEELPPSVLSPPAPVSIVPQTPPSPPAEEPIPSLIPIVDNDVLSSIPLPGEVNDSAINSDSSPSDQPSEETLTVSPTTETIETEDKENVAEDLQPKIVLKYNYKQDQWSPINIEGKKQYDRDFLLQLQSQPMSLCKPSNLPNLDVIKDKAQIQRMTDQVNRSSAPLPPPIRSFDPFVPNFAKGGTPKPPHPPMNRRSQQGRSDKKQQKIILLPSNQNIRLHESENAWKPSYKLETNDESAENAELLKKVRGILNKLTPQKFQTLVEQVKNLGINTEDKLKGVIDLIFEKAVDEPNFSVPYANMCKQLRTIEVPISGGGGNINFRKLLLTKCQREFEQERSDELKCEERMKAIETADPDKKKGLLLEIEEEEKKMRYRQLGNIRFIGELFKLKMLTEVIMHECVNKLLSQHDEESLECLCRLLKTIGKELDEGKSGKLMDQYFSVMQKIVDNRITSSRVRFMLQDVIDLKKSGWVPRRDENNPKTIDQIHEEAEKEAREKQQVFQNISSYPKRMPEDNRRKTSGRSMGTSEDGWTSSTKSSKGSYNMVDPSKLKLTKPDEVESMRLGPGGRGLQSWGRGSSGGAKTPAESDVKSTLTMNRYSALADTTMTPSYENRRGSQRSAASSRESSRGRNSQMSSTNVRKTPSASRERESLIEAVKGMSRTASAEPKNQETNRTNDAQLNGKASDAGVALSMKGPDYTEEEIEKKTKPLIDEFLHNADFEEAVQCVTELVSNPLTVHVFINSAINQVLERSSQTRLLLGQLFCLLVKKNIITLDHYKKGLEEVLENMDDYAVDIPLIWEYTAEIIEPMIEENKFPLSVLKELLAPCIPSDTAGKLVSHILHCAVKKSGPKKLGELWMESGLQWSDFLGSGTNISDFIHKYKVEFTVSPTKAAQKDMTAEEIRRQLKSVLEASEEVEFIFEWIDTNVPESAVNKPSFIRALVTAVHENAISGPVYALNNALLKKRLPILTRYIGRNKNLELQALFAIQQLMNQLNHPKNVLSQIFDVLYDDDVITEETFKQWEQNTDQEEQEGKAVAVMSVKPFFLWLREAESEGGDEE